MGTNYYLTTNECECCMRSDEYHIGKNSAGWVFGFYAATFAGLTVRSFDDWKIFLQKPGHIKDEYGHVVSYEEFIKIVESTKGARMRMTGKYDGYFADDEGYDFTEHDFS